MSMSIDVKGLSKLYRDSLKNRAYINVLDNFNLQISQGNFIVLYGPNGCGKSSLIHILAGIEKFDSGKVIVLGKSPEKAKIGIVFQNYSATLFPWLNVIDNICFSLKDFNNSKKRKIEKVERFIRRIKFHEILSFEKAYPYQLSGGQQQLVAIARALIGEPRIIFFDEAFSSLDSHYKDNALIQVQQFCKENNITSVYAIHDLDNAILMADRLLILNSNPMRIIKSINIDFVRPRTSKLFKSKKYFEIKKNVIEIIERFD